MKVEGNILGGKITPIVLYKLLDGNRIKIRELPNDSRLYINYYRENAIPYLAIKLDKLTLSESVKNGGEIYTSLDRWFSIFMGYQNLIKQ
ncbi:hypothetical protein D3C75_1155230 [compost metagenome]